MRMTSVLNRIYEIQEARLAAFREKEQEANRIQTNLEMEFAPIREALGEVMNFAAGPENLSMTVRDYVSVQTTTHVFFPLVQFPSSDVPIFGLEARNVGFGSRPALWMTKGREEAVMCSTNDALEELARHLSLLMKPITKPT